MMSRDLLVHLNSLLWLHLDFVKCHCLNLMDHENYSGLDRPPARLLSEDPSLRRPLDNIFRVHEVGP